MERKFTDDEIVKALECCCNNEDCIGCPCLDHGCHYEVQYSLDLINRQKAEIERLKKDNEYILMQHAFQRRPSGDCWNDVIEKAKTEAIKEFADIICEKLYRNVEDCDNMTVEDHTWVNRLKWAYEHTIIFIRDFIINREFENSIREERENNNER